MKTVQPEEPKWSCLQLNLLICLLISFSNIELAFIRYSLSSSFYFPLSTYLLSLAFQVYSYSILSWARLSSISLPLTGEPLVSEDISMTLVRVLVFLLREMHQSSLTSKALANYLYFSLKIVKAELSFVNYQFLLSSYSIVLSSNQVCVSTELLKFSLTFDFCPLLSISYTWTPDQAKLFVSFSPSTFLLFSFKAVLSFRAFFFYLFRIGISSGEILLRTEFCNEAILECFFSNLLGFCKNICLETRGDQSSVSPGWRGLMMRVYLAEQDLLVLKLWEVRVLTINGGHCPRICRKLLLVFNLQTMSQIQRERFIESIQVHAGHNKLSSSFLSDERHLGRTQAKSKRLRPQDIKLKQSIDLAAKVQYYDGIQQKFKHFQSQLQSLTLERNRLASNQSAKKQYEVRVQKQVQHQERAVRLGNQLNRLTQAIASKNQLLLLSNNQNSSLCLQNSKLKFAVKQLQQKLAFVSAEFERLTLQLQNYSAEMSSLQYSREQLVLKQMREQSLVSQLQRQQFTIHSKQQQSQGLRELLKKSQNNLLEMSSLQIRLIELNRDYQSLQCENHRLNESVKQKNMQVIQANRRNQHCVVRLHEFQFKVSELREEGLRKDRQMDRLRQSLHREEVEKKSLAERLQAKLRDSNSQNFKLRNSLGKMQEEIKRLSLDTQLMVTRNIQLEKYRNQLIDLQATLQAKESQIQALGKDKEQLAAKVRELKSDLQSAREYQAKAHQNILRVRQLSQKLSEQQGLYERLQRNLTFKEDTLDKLKEMMGIDSKANDLQLYNKTTSLVSQSRFYNLEIQRVKAQVGQRDQAVSRYQSQFQSAKLKSDQRAKETVQLQSLLRDTEGLLEQMRRQNNQLSHEVQTLKEQKREGQAKLSQSQRVCEQQMQRLQRLKSNSARQQSQSLSSLNEVKNIYQTQLQAKFKEIAQLKENNHSLATKLEDSLAELKVQASRAQQATLLSQDNAKMRFLSQELQNVKNQVFRSQKYNNELKQRNKQLQRLIGQLTASNSEKVREMHSIQTQKLKEVGLFMDRYQQEIRRLSEDIDALQQQNTSQKNCTALLKEKLAQAEHRVVFLQKENDSCQFSLSQTQTQFVLEKQKNDLLIKQLESKRAQLKSLEGSLNQRQLKEEMSSLQISFDSLQIKFKESDFQLKKSIQENHKLKTQLATCIGSLDLLKQKNGQLSSELLKTSQKAYLLQSSLIRIQSQKSSMQKILLEPILSLQRQLNGKNELIGRLQRDLLQKNKLSAALQEIQGELKRYQQRVQQSSKSVKLKDESITSLKDELKRTLIAATQKERDSAQKLTTLQSKCRHQEEIIIKLNQHLEHMEALQLRVQQLEQQAKKQKFSYQNIQKQALMQQVDRLHKSNLFSQDFVQTLAQQLNQTGPNKVHKGNDFFLQKMAYIVRQLQSNSSKQKQLGSQVYNLQQQLSALQLENLSLRTKANFSAARQSEVSQEKMKSLQQSVKSVQEKQSEVKRLQSLLLSSDQKLNRLIKQTESLIASLVQKNSQCQLLRQQLAK